MPQELLRHAAGAKRRPAPDERSAAPLDVTVVHVEREPQLSFSLEAPVLASAVIPPVSVRRVTDVDRWLAERRLWEAWLAQGETLARQRRVDGLVYNLQDQFPILAEFKTGNDKNPFHALLQLVMYAAELAAPERWHPAFLHSSENISSDSSETADLDALRLAGPLLDIYIILGDYDEQGAAQREMLDVTAPFCQRLLQDRSITNYLRRIVCLNTRRTKSGGLTCHKIFAFPELASPQNESAQRN
jgi:hypothetical protein